MCSTLSWKQSYTSGSKITVCFKSALILSQELSHSRHGEEMVTFPAMSRCLLQYLSPKFERLCHKLPKILPSNLFWCKHCTGSAVYTIFMLTVMKPRVLLQTRRYKPSVWNRIGRMCAWKKWWIRIRLCCQDIMLVFLAKLMQVNMWLHKFPNIVLKSGGKLRACTGVSDHGVWWTYKILFVHVLKLTICNLHLLSMWPC